MSSASIGLPDGAGSGPRISWTSSIALSRFVWAVQLGVSLGNGSRVECCRGALAVWIRKLDISVDGIENGAPASSVDEAMLDRRVVSFRCGWTPKEVLVCFFSGF